MPSPLKAYRLQVETLTPVHVGSGELHDRLEYIISDSEVVLVDYRVLIQDPATRKRLNIELDKIISASSPSAIPSSHRPLNMGAQKKYSTTGTNDRALIEFQKQVLPHLLKMCPAAVLSRIPATADARRRLTSEGVVGKGVINSLPRSGCHPYLPGSSIKGAMRTALIYSMMGIHERKKLEEMAKLKREKINESAQKGRTQEARDVFKDFCNSMERTIETYTCFKDKEKNYFRHIRVSDVIFSAKDIFVDCVLRHSIKPKPNASLIPNYAELFFDGVTHDGDLNIDTRCSVFNAEKVQKACNDFYKPQLDAWLKEINLDFVRPVEEMKNAFFIRIGGYAGAISKTFPETRCINVMPPNLRKDKGAIKGVSFKLETSPKTRCLNEQDNHPLGWVLCALEEK